MSVKEILIRIMELHWTLRLWNVLTVKVEQLKQLIPVNYISNPIKTGRKMLITLTSPTIKGRLFQ